MSPRKSKTVESGDLQSQAAPGCVAGVSAHEAADAPRVSQSKGAAGRRAESGGAASGAPRGAASGQAQEPVSPPISPEALIERVRNYDPDLDPELLRSAYEFARVAHGDQRRHSGEPYFYHPLEVARILTELKADPATIATALLHDVIEDTVATREQVAERFGEEIAQLVDGVTKLSLVALRGEASKEAENFRKLILAMSKDVRVLLVKLADRLHNMRTLAHHPREEGRLRIAAETMDIFAPLAGRIGVHQFREELEDLAFAVINPAARTSIIRRLEYLRPSAQPAIREITAAIQEKLSEQGVRAEVVSREKRPYSIWRKMEKKNISFEQLADIYAVRVIVETGEDCYRALGVIHGEWKYIPGYFKDYISTPKPNNYQSLHTAIWAPHMRQVELQVRTRYMDAVAERGVAAHWRYKDPELRSEHAERANSHDPYQWMQGVVKMLEHGDDPEEFLENTKLELFRDHVFVFTPKGRLIELPRGATPVDFAYAVHTDIGDTCVGAKINGRPAPLRTPLRNGDMVEILRSSSAQPAPHWESLVVTGRARSAIRRLIRRSEKDEYIKLGMEIASSAAETDALELSPKAIKAALKRLKAASVEEVYEQLGRGDLLVEDVLDAAFPGRPKRPAKTAVAPKEKPSVGPQGMVAGGPGAIPISGLQAGIVVHMAQCCCPLPGDRIVGIRTPGKGVVIHTIDCERLAEEDPPQARWLDLKWRADASKKVNAVGRIVTTVRNAPGVLGEVSSVIANYKGNISNIRITTREMAFFDLQVDIEVKDVRHLTNIVTALRASPSVIEASRVRG